jgi:hypothetical protein
MMIGLDWIGLGVREMVKLVNGALGTALARLVTVEATIVVQTMTGEGKMMIGVSHVHNTPGIVPLVR